MRRCRTDGGAERKGGESRGQRSEADTQGGTPREAHPGGENPGGDTQRGRERGWESEGEQPGTKSEQVKYKGGSRAGGARRRG